MIAYVLQNRKQRRNTTVTSEMVRWTATHSKASKDARCITAQHQGPPRLGAGTYYCRLAPAELHF